MDLMAIYKRLTKHRGRAKIKASVIAALPDGTPVKLVFVRDSRKTDWLALLSTDVTLGDEQIVQTYGRRQDGYLLRKNSTIFLRCYHQKKSHQRELH